MATYCFFSPVDFKRRLAAEYEKELPTAAMRMPNLLSSWRHALLDDGDFRLFDEMPSITCSTPDVVLCLMLRNHWGVLTDIDCTDNCRHRFEVDAPASIENRAGIKRRAHGPRINVIASGQQRPATR